jgi:hypothetical protein
MKMKKIAFFDYTTGQYTFHDIGDNIAELIAKKIMQTTMHYTHNAPWNIVEINDDGSYTWKNAVEQIMPTPLAVEEELRKLIEAHKP